MRFLVAGAGGFIGRSLTRRLLCDGHRVTAVDRRADRLPGGERGGSVRNANDDGVQAVAGDLLELDLHDLLADVEAVAHLAGRGNVGESWGDASSYIRDNIEATDRLCRQVAATDHISTLLLASSSSVYAGTPPWSESAVTSPASPYGVTKLAAEHVARVRLAGSRTRLVTARLFSVYGPDQRPDLVLSRLIECALAGEAFELHGDGGQRRDFTFIDDAVEYLARLLNTDAVGVFNVCTGVSFSLHDVIAIVSDLLGKRVRMNSMADIRLVGVAETWGINSKLVHGYGPLAWTPLHDGIRQQIEWRLGTGPVRQVRRVPGRRASSADRPQPR